MASIRSQWPVRTQMQTMETDREKDTNSGMVNLPHNPNDNLWEGMIFYEWLVIISIGN